MNTITTTAHAAVNITARPEAAYLVRVNESESLNYLIEGRAWTATEHGFAYVVFTVWMGGIMVELKVPATAEVTIATDA